jgi:hypothetical protein
MQTSTYRIKLNFKIQPKYSKCPPPAFFSVQYQNNPLPVELPPSVPQVLPDLQPNFTKWTSGDSLKTFRRLKSSPFCNKLIALDVHVTVHRKTR